MFEVCDLPIVVVTIMAFTYLDCDVWIKYSSLCIRLYYKWSQIVQNWLLFKVHSWKKSEISLDFRKQIVAFHKSGLGYKVVSNRLCMSHSAVQYTVKKEKLWGTVKNLNRPGRKRKIWRTLEWNIICNDPTNLRTSVKDIKAHPVKMGVDVSNSTIERCLQHAGLKSRRLRQTPSPQKVQYKCMLEVC